MRTRGVNRWRGKLPRANCAKDVAKASAENVNSKLLALAAIDTCKNDLQKNLRLRLRHHHLQEIHHFSRYRCDFNGALTALNVVCGPTQKYRAILRGQLE